MSTQISYFYNFLHFFGKYQLTFQIKNDYTTIVSDINPYRFYNFFVDIDKTIPYHIDVIRNNPYYYEILI